MQLSTSRSLLLLVAVILLSCSLILIFGNAIQDIGMIENARTCKFKKAKQFSLDEPFFVQDSKECPKLRGLVSKTADFDKPKVRVLSAHVMKPELVRLQKRSLELFLEDEYEYIVYGGDAPTNIAAENNMWNPTVNNAIENVAKEIGIKFRRIPPEIHQHRECIFPKTSIERSTLNPTQNSRSSDAIQFMFRDAINFCSRDLIVILDADMILIKSISFQKLLGNYNAAGIEQGRTDMSAGGDVHLRYMFTGPLLFDMNGLPKKDLINFDWGHVHPEIGGHKFHLFLDTSGFTYEWLLQAAPKVLWLDRDANENHHRLAKIWTEKVTSKFPLLDSSSFEYCANKTVLHLRNGSNWKKLGKNYNESIKYEYEAINDFISSLKPSKVLAA